TDDLTLIHEQGLRLDELLDRQRREGAAPGTRASPELVALRDQAQTLEESEKVDQLAASFGNGATSPQTRAEAVPTAAARLRAFYHPEVGALHGHRPFRTTL